MTATQLKTEIFELKASIEQLWRLHSAKHFAVYSELDAEYDILQNEEEEIQHKYCNMNRKYPYGTILNIHGVEYVILDANTFDYGSGKPEINYTLRKILKSGKLSKSEILRFQEYNSNDFINFITDKKYNIEAPETIPYTEEEYTLDREMLDKKLEELNQRSDKRVEEHENSPDNIQELSHIDAQEELLRLKLEQYAQLTAKLPINTTYTYKGRTYKIVEVNALLNRKKIYVYYCVQKFLRKRYSEALNRISEKTVLQFGNVLQSEEVAPSDLRATPSPPPQKK